MNIYKLLKDYWHIITTVTTAVIISAFIIGNYYMKVEYMMEEIAKNTQKLETIFGSGISNICLVSSIAGFLLKIVPHIIQLSTV